MPHYRVYTGRPFYEAEQTTLEREAEARRYAVASPHDANLIVDAADTKRAIRTASAHNRGETLTVFRGPRKAVPVIINNVAFTGTW